jgi:hypothetical protein
MACLSFEVDILDSFYFNKKVGHFLLRKRHGPYYRSGKDENGVGDELWGTETNVFLPLFTLSETLRTCLSLAGSVTTLCKKRTFYCQLEMLLIIHLVALHPCRKLSIFLSQGGAMLFS